MKRLFYLTLLIVVSLPLTFASGSSPQPPPPDSPEELANLESAIQDSLGAERDSLLGILAPDVQVENMEISQDGKWGIGWVIPTDPETGLPVPIEPGVVVTARDGADWRVWLPSSNGWIDQIKAVPAEILNQDIKETLVNQSRDLQVAMPSAALTGYKLPWAAGITRNLTQSTCHDEYSSNEDAHHAFDFSTSGTMWNIYAAKAGVVWLWRDDFPTCLEATCSDVQSPGNYVVLKDDSTDPVSYQLYLHLAADSIPDEIKVRNTPIGRGQFVGIVDNTGKSWGHHLHFQVQIPVYGVENYWGRSVDITFQDVDINGGRPRVINGWCNDATYCNGGDVCDTFRAPYTSQNVITTDSIPPQGEMLTPAANQIFNGNSIQLQGQASDDKSGLKSAQFMAYYAGAWQDIGPEFSTSTFSYNWNWCNADVPDGPLSLALRLEDNAGNQNLSLPGLRNAAKQHACAPTPNCSPRADQIAIFEAINYQGQCKVLGIGDYANTGLFAPVGDDEIESVLLGANVLATLFTAANYQGRAETLEADDPNLSENRVGSNHVSALKVRSQNNVPALPLPLWPAFGQTFLDSTSQFLSWNDGGEASQMRVRLEGPSGVVTSTWGSAATWNLGSLAAGAYSWQIQGKNDFAESAWSGLQFFIVNADSTALPTSVNVPYSASMEGIISNWRTTGLWHLTETDSNSATHSWWYSQSGTGTYETGGIHSGDLTSPPINLPVSANPYQLQFVYKTKTERIDSHWDQRWVQISVDGGEFVNIAQLNSDPVNEWLTSKIDLSPFYAAGVAHTLRVRFHFSTVDALENNFGGWYIDDVSVSAVAPLSCSDAHEANDSPSAATVIAYSQVIQAAICPGFDLDYYTFDGAIGDQIVVDIDAKTAGSPLDSRIYLLSEDGTSILAEHDDEVLAVRVDPHLGFQLPYDGQYYLKIQAWNRPEASGAYTMTLFTDATPPNASLSPTDNTYRPAEVINLSMTAADGLSGVSHVDFWAFITNKWEKIQEDWEASDGWTSTFDATGFSNGQSVDFYALAYDWAGNNAGRSAWPVTVDTAYPDTSADPLTTPNSTAIHLKWVSVDALSGLRNIHIRHQKNSESWITTEYDAAVTETWFVGDAGANYTFRIRGIDNVGNIEPYAEGAQLSTTIPAIGTLCAAPDAWDASAAVNDNAIASATPLDSSPQTHNFCNPLAANRLNDVDWFSFWGQNGQTYAVLVTPTHPAAAVKIEFFRPNGTTLIASTTPNEFGDQSMLTWVADQDGVVYVRLTHIDGRVAGDVVGYEVRLARAVIYFPLIFK